MSYTSHTYLGTVTRDRDGLVVAPAHDTDNPDFLEYLAYCNAGGAVAVDDTPAPETAAIPESVTPWQIRKALNQLNLRDAVEAAVAQQSRDVRDGWEFATEFRRDDALLCSMAVALGIDMDAVFALAATL